jgi:glyoxylase-like metal-dependent hydrolase (beta-lactamase superfamily II)
MRDGLVATIGLLIAGAATAGPAGALQPKAQAPGFYRMTLGAFQVIALNDGVIPYQTAQLLPDASPARIEKSLSEMGVTDPFGMSYNAYLIDTGEKLVLIDTGTGGKLAESPFFRGGGRLLANLRAAGYRPEEVDEIYITHLGPDHVGGLTRGKVRAFPNARLRAAKNEVAVFLNRKTGDSAASDWRFGFWNDLFAPYIAAGKFAAFDSDTALVPGIRALATPGHTPGHTSYLVESEGRTLLVLGDLVLVAAMQFAEPALESSFDADRPAAAAQRRRIMELAARENHWVAGSHLSFPGIGHVRNGEPGFRWLPADYAIPE